MFNFKIALSAIALELAAWSSLLLQEHSDWALLGYLLLHALSSLLLAMLLVPFLPKRMAKPRWAAWLLLSAVSYSVPLFGFLGVLAAFIFLVLYRKNGRREDYASLELPEFDQHQRRQSNVRHVGMRSFLGNAQVPLQTRMRAMAALQYVPGKTASPLLHGALNDSNEDLRLLAYGMLDNLEKRVNQNIDQELDLLATAQATRDSAQILESSRQLADLYWELVYQELVQGDLRDHAVQQALHFCQQVIKAQKDNAHLLLRQGRLQHELGQAEQAQASYNQALALGMPITRVLPYRAELLFKQRNFEQVQAIMQELEQWGALPRLSPVINYWKQHA